MSKRLELLEKCDLLNLTPQKSRARINKVTGEKYFESTIKDLQKAIQQYYINERAKNNKLNPFLLDIVKMDSPMLALPSKGIKNKQILDTIWKDNSNWILQEKIDGCRILACFSPATGWDFYSRNLSVVDCLPISYKTKLLIPTPSVDYSFIIDCELIPKNKLESNMTQLDYVNGLLGSLDELAHSYQKLNPLKLIAFDIIKLQGNWIINMPYKSRFELLRTLLKTICIGDLKEYLQLVPYTLVNKHDFYNQIINLGGEGCVAKNLDSIYDILGKRNGDWVKLKRTISQSILSEKVGDTIDVFVTGFKVGNVGTNRFNQVSALECSVYLTDDNNEYLLDNFGNPIIHHIATISGLSDELRLLLTHLNPDNSVSLNPIFYGAVLEIDGQDISSKNKRFMNAIFKGWRKDRSADSCKLMSSLLDKLIL